MTTLEEIWPVFGLRVDAGPVELSAIATMTFRFSST